MSLQNIIANTKGVLAAVSGVVNVYDHKKYVNNDADFNTFFKSGNTIQTWMITREGTQAEDRGPNNEYDVHSVVIAGYMSVQESGATEAAFQVLVETVRAAFLANRRLNFNNVKAAHWSGPTSARQVNYVMFGGVLCHYCELVTKVEDGPNSTMSA